MNKDRKSYHLKQQRLKENPFGVPEGYFEGFSERLQERISKEDGLTENPFGVPEGYFEGFAGRLQERIQEEDSSRVPVRRMFGGARSRIAMAAAVVGLALISYSIVKFNAPGEGAGGNFPEMALMENLQMFDDDRYLYDLIHEVEEEMDEEEAFAAQAIEYLAINDAEMLLLIE